MSTASFKRRRLASAGLTQEGTHEFEGSLRGLPEHAVPDAVQNLDLGRCAGKQDVEPHRCGRGGGWVVLPGEDQRPAADGLGPVTDVTWAAAAPTEVLLHVVVDQGAGPPPPSGVLP